MFKEPCSQWQALSIPSQARLGVQSLQAVAVVLPMGLRTGPNRRLVPFVVVTGNHKDHINCFGGGPTPFVESPNGQPPNELLAAPVCAWDVLYLPLGRMFSSPNTHRERPSFGCGSKLKS